ncbi:MAG: hypothetical protein HYT28_01260 [Parcubacteria group bacterium]|nr:hypothetical protein [Parcubacteria group bacterium]
MCFSAPVSFAASGVLAATGVGVIKRKPLRREILFAIIPFLFAFQQSIEGLQWLAIKQGEQSLFLGYVFLFFAFLIWPIYIPLSIYKMEETQKRARILRIFISAGVIATAYLLFILLKQPLEILVVGQSIQYLINIPLGDIGAFAYLAIVAGGCFVSSDRHIRWFGSAILASFFITFFLFRVTLISTWCFFAAILSFMIYFHFVKKTSGLSKNKKQVRI